MLRIPSYTPQGEQSLVHQIHVCEWATIIQWPMCTGMLWGSEHLCPEGRIPGNPVEEAGDGWASFWGIQRKRGLRNYRNFNDFWGAVSRQSPRVKTLSEPHGKAGGGLLSAMLHSWETGVTEWFEARESHDRSRILVFWEAFCAAMLRVELECPERKR